MKEKKQITGLLLPALLCTLLWGSAFPGVKSGYQLFGITENPFDKLFFAGWRFMLAGIVVLAVFCVMHRRAPLPQRRTWRGIALLGITQTTMQYVFFYIGLSHTTGVKGSVLTATTTFLAVGLSHFCFPNDRLTRNKMLGCAIGFAGVVLISVSASDSLSGLAWNGEGFMMISAAAAAVGAVISKKIAGNADPMVITGWQLTFGGGILLLMGTLGGGQFVHTSPKAFALLGYLIFLSACAFTVWTMLLKKYPVGKVTVYNFLVPVFGSVMSAIVLGESILHVKNMLSLLCVCAGIVLVNRQNPQQ